MVGQVHFEQPPQSDEPHRPGAHLTHMDVTTVTRDLDPGLAASSGGTAGLVHAAATGDDAAFEQLVTARLARTYRMAMAILGSEADARDAVQDAWVAAWRQLRSLVDPARFDSWLDQIVINACRQRLRKRGRIREIALSDDFDIEAPQPGPEAVSERMALDRAFGGLGVEQRAILVLHHLEHKPVTEIAETLGIPVGTAKSRLHTARAALQRNLEAER
jgi:RNA polymerase sigma-70 factor (ECF subfamily)